jgi:hypothetical protein
MIGASDYHIDRCIPRIHTRYTIRDLPFFGNQYIVRKYERFSNERVAENKTRAKKQERIKKKAARD